MYMKQEPFSDQDRIFNKFSNLQNTIGKLSTLALTISAMPQSAVASLLSDANTKLGGYGLPPIVFVPPNFVPLVSEYGRGSNDKPILNPILVQFAHPSSWVTQKTAVNNNGESGTVGANDYIKGDSANLFERNMPSGESLSINNKKLITQVLMEALGRKGDVLESFKVYQIESNGKGIKGEEYFIAYFSYALNTEAGFLINRKGIASFTNVGPNIQALITGTTDKRYGKGLEQKLKDIATSFRVYKLNSGVFSTE